MPKKLLIIGAGASGVFAAIHASMNDPSLKVTILEKSSKILSKVKVSGGGRCNVTHACFNIGEMSRNYPRGMNFVKKTFHQFFTKDTIQWFADRGVELKTEADGRMFPVTDSSQTIIDCLVREMNRHGIELLMNADVKELSNYGNGFACKLADGREMKADYVCVACGGFPKSSMFEWLRKTGHSIEEPVPSLFTFNLPSHPITKLMGISVEDAFVKIRKTNLESRGPLLITHWGLSGPVVLRLSAWGARQLAAEQWNFSIQVNWVPEFNEQRLKERLLHLRRDEAKARVSARNFFGLPQRLWEFLVDASGIMETTRWAELKAKETNKLIENLINSQFDVKGKTTFKEEFVTAGGIKLSEIDPQTMMSRKVPNLYFAGEIMDVDGITGGFNFQHAWTSGYIAGTNIGRHHLSS